MGGGGGGGGGGWGSGGGGRFIIRLFEKWSYYVIPLGVCPSIHPSVNFSFSDNSYSLSPIELNLGM